MEEVGFEAIRAQQARLRELRVVLVDGARIAGLRDRPWKGNATGSGDGDGGGRAWEREVESVRRTCGRIEELDLSRGCLERWVDLVGICRGLVRLRRVVLE